MNTISLNNPLLAQQFEGSTRQRTPPPVANAAARQNSAQLTVNGQKVPSSKAPPAVAALASASGVALSSTTTASLLQAQEAQGA
jgi:hypothetical protein